MYENWVMGYPLVMPGDVSDVDTLSQEYLDRCLSVVNSRHGDIFMYCGGGNIPERVLCSIVPAMDSEHAHITVSFDSEQYQKVPSVSLQEFCEVYPMMDAYHVFRRGVELLDSYCPSYPVVHSPNALAMVSIVVPWWVIVALYEFDEW